MGYFWPNGYDDSRLWPSHFWGPEVFDYPIFPSDTGIMSALLLGEVQFIDDDLGESATMSLFLQEICDMPEQIELEESLSVALALDESSDIDAGDLEEVVAMGTIELGDVEVV